MAGIDPRKTTISMTYNRSDVSKKIANYVENVTYEANATGSADSLSISLDNSDARFNTSQMPKKGDRINAKLNFHNWLTAGKTFAVKCGIFMVDDVSFSGEPNVCDISGVSMPVKGNFKTQRTKAYKKITLKELGKKIAKRAGIKLYYEGPVVNIKEIEQSDISDSEFLMNTCKEYGFGMKIYNGKIVIYDEETYEKKKPVATINKKDCLDYNWNTTMQKTYTEAKVKYTDPSNDKNHCITIGSKGRTLTTNATAFSKKDAGLKAKAVLADENKKATTMSITIEPNARIVETSVVNIRGFGKLNGKYFVEKIRYSISGGTKFSLELRKIMARASMGSIKNVKVSKKKKQNNKRKKTVTKVKRK